MLDISIVNETSPVQLGLNHVFVILSRLCDTMYHVCVILQLRQVLETEKNILQINSLLVLATHSEYVPKIHFKLFLEQKNV